MHKVDSLKNRLRELVITIAKKILQIYIKSQNLLNSITAVCICFAEGLTERYFFVPFEIWLNMEKHFGKKSVTAEDLKSFEIFYKHSIGIDFLKNIKIKIEKGE